MMVQKMLKYFSSFWITLEMSLINCEINLTLTCTERCFIIDPPIVGQKFTVTYRKLYVPFLTLSTQDNTKLLKQIK